MSPGDIENILWLLPNYFPTQDHTDRKLPDDKIVPKSLLISLHCTVSIFMLLK